MSETRKEFLTDILTGAIECGVAWFEVHEYEWEGTDDPYAVISDTEDDGGELFRVDLALIRKGLHVIAMSEMRVPADGLGRVMTGSDNEPVLHNRKTGQRLYLAPSRKKEILLASRTNGDEGDLDVLDYHAIVECGLFGAVTYA